MRGSVLLEFDNCLVQSLNDICWQERHNHFFLAVLSSIKGKSVIFGEINFIANEEL